MGEDGETRWPTWEIPRKTPKYALNFRVGSKNKAQSGNLKHTIFLFYATRKKDMCQWQIMFLKGFNLYVFKTKKKRSKGKVK